MVCPNGYPVGAFKTAYAPIHTIRVDPPVPEKEALGVPSQHYTFGARPVRRCAATASTFQFRRLSLDTGIADGTVTTSSIRHFKQDRGRTIPRTALEFAIL